MTKLEQIEFDTEEKFLSAINQVINGGEAFRTYKTKSGEDKTVKIISNNRLYVGNNFSVNINKANDGKVYLSLDYFGVEDRIRIAQNKNESESTENQLNL